ncbi:septum site-determining protein Ssd [Corynebacterium tapiri]|nr:septum site-determining protein Ssd [Corynebacterium tapiri]
MNDAMNDAAHRTEAFVVVAVGDPTLHPEAVHIAAASTRPVIDVSTSPHDVARHSHRAAAVLVDAEFAPHLPDSPVGPPRFFLTPDGVPMAWNAALAAHAQQAFSLPAESAELLRALAKVSATGASPRAAIGGNAVCIAVVGSAGGAGASTLAAAIARRAGGAVTLVDADPRSGGIDLLLGVEDAPGLRWPDIPGGEQGLNHADLRAALIQGPDQLAVLSAARSTIDDPFRLTASALDALLSSLRGGGGVIVVDAPPELINADLTVIVCPTEVRAAASAARLAARLRAQRLPHVIVARNRGWAGLEESEVERITSSSVLATLPSVRGLAKDTELGGLPRRLPAALARLADDILSEVGA